MIGYLSGLIKDIDTKSRRITVLVNGVGYLVVVSSVLLTKHNTGDEIELFIEPEIREDAFDLIGFTSIDERNFYNKIREVKGMGPKTAVNVFSLEISELKMAIETEDVKTLCTIPGLGKKTAERLILELKGNLPSLNEVMNIDNAINKNVVQALTSLGYKSKDIEEALKEIPDSVQGEEDIIKFFLTNIK